MEKTIVFLKFKIFWEIIDKWNSNFAKNILKYFKELNN